MRKDLECGDEVMWEEPEEPLSFYMLQRREREDPKKNRW